MQSRPSAKQQFSFVISADNMQNLRNLIFINYNGAESM